MKWLDEQYAVAVAFCLAQMPAVRGLLAEIGIANALIGYESPAHNGAIVLLDGRLQQDQGGDWPVVILDPDDDEALLLADMAANAGITIVDDGTAGDPDGVPARWLIVISCATEADQRALIDRFVAEGFSCRALIS